MCGRYSHSKEHKYDVYIGEYQIEIIFGRRFNIAPTQKVPVIKLENGKPVLKEMKWGLIPFFSEEPKMGFSTMNAKAETLKSKPMWKRLLKEKRCLVPADGFYEWEKVEDSKQPWRFVLKNREPFLFAGLWDSWSDPNQELQTFTIITTAANSLVSKIHNRMPVVVAKSDYAVWLNDAREDLLRPYPESEMECYRVSRVVNSARNELAECIEPWK